MSEEVLYHNITLSPTTKKKRQQIKTLQDDFMTFSWGGVDAFTTFGAFILNDKKGSLKFYNGPGFSNEYSKPQFDNAGGKIVGVNFNKQTISFSIGVYWISIKHYRLLIDWLSPLKTADLSFGHDPRYRYNVKLSKIGDSTRYVVGREGDEYMYYTELNLSFEVQGDACAKGVNAYEWNTEYGEISVAVENEKFVEMIKNDNYVEYFVADDNSLGNRITEKCSWEAGYWAGLLEGDRCIIQCNKEILSQYNLSVNIFVVYGRKVVYSHYINKDELTCTIVFPHSNCGMYINVVGDEGADLSTTPIITYKYKPRTEYWKIAGSGPLALSITLNKKHDFIPSDLPTPFEVGIPLQIYGSSADDSIIKYNIDLSLVRCKTDEAMTPIESIPLFNVDLKNLTHTLIGNENVLNLNLNYNSQTGLVYLKYGNSSEKILTLLSLNDIGERIVDSFISYKASLPGEFNYPNFYADNNLKLKLVITKHGGLVPQQFYQKLLDESQIICYPRTNLI